MQWWGGWRVGFLDLSTVPCQSQGGKEPYEIYTPRAVVPIGLSPPCDLALPAWPILTSVFTLPFPWVIVPTEPPD